MGEYVLCRMQLNMVFENNKMYIIRKMGQKYVDKHKQE